MTGVSTIDDKTATAIREAVSAARSGRVTEALSIGERALAAGGDVAALNAMIGTLHCQTGNLDAGIRHLQAARKAKPSDPVVSSNLATALAEKGDFAGALDALPEAVAQTDPSMQLLRLRAFLAQQVGDYDVAIPTYESIVAGTPDDWESWNNLGNARRLSGDVEGSVAALERAFAINPESPPIRMNHAMALAAIGRVDEAEKHLRKMAEDYPHDAKPLRELHAILKELGRDEPALDAIEEAAKREPLDTDLTLALAGQRLNLLRMEAAEEAYRQVVAREPGNALANLGLAVVFELTNRTGELSRLVGEAANRGVGEDVLNFIRAFDHRRGKRFEEGLAALRRVPDELETARRFHLLGQLEEGAGNYDEAFAAFTRMNDIQRDDTTRPEERGAAYRGIIRHQLETQSAEWLEGWSETAADNERTSPAFLMGFPRSGTTLLDTMLMGHPEVEVLEEEPTLLNATKILPFDAIQSASDEQVRSARDEYFRVAAERTPLAKGKLLIDKNPLSLNALPIIRRLFPDARIILALRHPCDVVFSCFATNFKLNDGMSNFLRLDTAAELYDLSFSNFEKAQSLFGLPVHKTIYENVVSDREAELRSLLDFLGLNWSDQVLDHESTALSRGRIKTASYAQVAQPIYSQSAGRWTNYRKHVEPILPVLEPWIAKFGYSV